MKRIIIILFVFIFLTGCKTEDVEIVNKVLKDDKYNISINVNDNIKSDTKLIVEEITKDYSKLLKTDKYRVYNISLSNKEKLNNKVKVNLTLPVDFSRENIKVYYLKDDKIKEEYDVEINKDRVSFYTTHLSEFALVELKGE